MDLHWRDYISADAELVNQWIDCDASAMTGIDSDWDTYWNDVIADAVNYPGCKDFCKIVSISGVPVAAVVFGCYRGEAVISEIVVAPTHRAKGVGSRIIKELVEKTDVWFDEKIKQFRAIVFSYNHASQKAFQNAGFAMGCTHDKFTFEYVYKITR